MSYKRILITIILITSVFTLISQNIFVLERPGSIRNFKYYPKNPIHLKLISPDTVISGKISHISDSSILVNYNEILINNIKCIYTKPWGFNFLQKITLMLGIPYLFLSAANGLVNYDSPIVSEETLIIGGSLVAAGIILIPFAKRKHKIDNKRWRVIILDFTDD